MSRPRTLKELKASGYRSRSVRDEMRENLIRLLRRGERLFAGIIGYEHTVEPQIVNAILSRHDFILLGLRGQAKTRLLRSLLRFLDEWVPAIRRLSAQQRSAHSAHAPRAHADRGATVTTRRSGGCAASSATRRSSPRPTSRSRDLIGDIDPIKAATLKLDYSDERVIHYGIIPRTNRGIFAINELPDLQPRIQVGLLNMLEEKDFQIRGFPVRMPLDVLMVFSANPEDYTNRGNIITPLRDRINSQIITHYPSTREQGMAITEQESWTSRDGRHRGRDPDVHARADRGGRDPGAQERVRRPELRRVRRACRSRCIENAWCRTPSAAGCAPARSRWSRGCATCSRRCRR